MSLPRTANWAREAWGPHATVFGYLKEGEWFTFLPNGLPEDRYIKRHGAWYSPLVEGVVAPGIYRTIARTVVFRVKPGESR